MSALSTEVAVVGGGITGLSTAYALQRRGVDYVCFEAALPGSGQSAGRTRVFRHGHDDERLVRLAVRARAEWERLEDELEEWQLEVTHQFPRELLRGLIHSDGCRTVNRFKTRLPSGRVAPYEYPRYFFSNLSEDIRRIFCDHCELLGIRWTQSNPRNISISHRKSVALLDEFIGPKW